MSASWGFFSKMDEDLVLLWPERCVLLKIERLKGYAGLLLVSKRGDDYLGYLRYICIDEVFVCAYILYCINC